MTQSFVKNCCKGVGDNEGKNLDYIHKRYHIVGELQRVFLENALGNDLSNKHDLKGGDSKANHAT